MMRRLLAVLLMWSILFRVDPTYAQTVPVSRIQNAISGVIQSKLFQRGFAANDPRFSSTLVNSGSAIAGGAAAAALVTAAGITAPAWVTAAITIGLATLFTGGISLAVDGALKWIFNSDGTVTAPQLDAGAVAIAPGMAVYASGCGFSSAYRAFATSPAGIASGCLKWVNQNLPTLQFVSADCGSGDCYYQYQNGGTQYCRGCYTMNVTAPSVANCDTGTYIDGIGCLLATSKAMSVADAISSIPASTLGQPLNNDLVAAIANQAWKQAASQSGYAGIPYDVANPISSADVSTWRQANPSLYPTVADFVAPQPAPSGGTAATPFSLPNTAGTTAPVSQPTQGTNPAASQPLENLGSDPAIGSPQLEATPTALMILSPLLGLFPSFKNFVVPSHQSVCPTPTFSLFGKSIVMDAQCVIAEGQRQNLYAVMAVVWVIVAAFIVLGA